MPDFGLTVLSSDVVVSVAAGVVLEFEALIDKEATAVDPDDDDDDEDDDAGVTTGALMADNSAKTASLIEDVTNASAPATFTPRGAIISRMRLAKFSDSVSASTADVAPGTG